ncbi:MAG: 6,7-dimethyl-8-ribityllumazine synthase [Nevskia sp.]
MPAGTDVTTKKLSVKKAVAKKTPVSATAIAPIAKSGYAASPQPAAGEFRHARIALLATRWNLEVVDALLAGARACLKDWGVVDKHVEEFRAPGAFELPLAASALMKSGKYDGVVVLGAVIRGDTPHFEFVAGECSRGLREAAQKHRTALGFGVLTVNTPAQAAERCGPGKTNKGYEAAEAALEMIHLLGAIDD